MRLLLLFCLPLAAFNTADIDAVANSFLEKNRSMALAIAIVHTDSKQANPTIRKTYSYGTISKCSRIPVNQHTEFRIGSLTETFTGALLALMVRDGRAQLSAPAVKYLPRSSHVPVFHDQKISLADLASSTSGLPNIPYAIDARSALSVSKLFRILSTYKLKMPPGKQYAPSNVGYALLANLLSRIGRASYPDLLKTKILKPLRMNDTEFSLSPEKRSRRATGYEDGYAVPAQIGERRYSVFQGASGLFSTIDDMSMWLLFNLKIFTGPLGPILPIMHQSIHEIDGENGVALGWNVRNSHSKHLYSKSDSLLGFSSYIGFIPENHLGVVVLSNNGDYKLDELGNKLLSLIQR